VDGAEEGMADGDVGNAEGARVGTEEGVAVGHAVGANVGDALGTTVGTLLGRSVGTAVGGAVFKSRDGIVPSAVYTVRITSLKMSVTNSTGRPSIEYAYVTDRGYAN